MTKYHIVAPKLSPDFVDLVFSMGTMSIAIRNNKNSRTILGGFCEYYPCRVCI